MGLVSGGGGRFWILAARLVHLAATVGDRARRGRRGPRAEDVAATREPRTCACKEASSAGRQMARRHAHMQHAGGPWAKRRRREGDEMGRRLLRHKEAAQDGRLGPFSECRFGGLCGDWSVSCAVGARVEQDVAEVIELHGRDPSKKHAERLAGPYQRIESPCARVIYQKLVPNEGRRPRGAAASHLRHRASVVCEAPGHVRNHTSRPRCTALTSGRHDCVVTSACEGSHATQSGLPVAILAQAV